MPASCLVWVKCVSAGTTGGFDVLLAWVLVLVWKSLFSLVGADS